MANLKEIISTVGDLLPQEFIVGMVDGGAKWYVSKFNVPDNPTSIGQWKRSKSPFKDNEVLKFNFDKANTTGAMVKKSNPFQTVFITSITGEQVVVNG